MNQLIIESGALSLDTNDGGQTNLTSNSFTPVRLPPEIWTKIFTLVKEPKPEVTSSSSRARRSSRTRPYGQSGLAACMRVCKEFYHLTAPILYQEVIVDDLIQFFYGLEPRKNPSVGINQSSGTWSKIELFAYTKKLHLVHSQRKAAKHYGPYPPQHYLERFGDPGVNLTIPMISDCNMLKCIMANVFIPWCKDSDTSSLFPNLQIASTAAFGSSDWDCHAARWPDIKPIALQDLRNPNPTIVEWAQALALLDGDFLANFMGCVSSPTHSCSYVNNGPQAYASPSSLTLVPSMQRKCASNLEFHTCHITEKVVDSNTDVKVVEGCLNRWVVHFEFASKPLNSSCHAVYWLYRQLGWIKNRFTSESTLRSGTTIQVYNVLDTRTARAFVKYEYGIHDFNHPFLQDLRRYLNRAIEGSSSIKLMQELAEPCPSCEA